MSAGAVWMARCTCCVCGASTTNAPTHSSVFVVLLFDELNKNSKKPLPSEGKFEKKK
jgi:hypothetical protein